MTNCYTDDCVIPRAGRFAAASLWVPGLNAAVDLNNLRVEIDGTPTAPSFIGRRLPNAPWQVNVYLPPGARTGILPVRLLHEGLPREVAGALRVIQEGPATPRVVNLCDGVNLLSKLNIESARHQGSNRGKLLMQRLLHCSHLSERRSTVIRLRTSTPFASIRCRGFLS